MPLLEDIYQRERMQLASTLLFSYSAHWLASELAAGLSIPKNTAIQSDSHFIARYITITTYAAGLVVSTATSPLLVNFFDTGSGRQILDSPQPIQNLCGGVAAAAGQGSLPFVLPEPWLIRSGGTITTTLTNLGAAAVVQAEISFVGFKVFDFTGAKPADLDTPIPQNQAA